MRPALEKAGLRKFRSHDFAAHVRLAPDSGCCALRSETARDGSKRQPAGVAPRERGNYPVRNNVLVQRNRLTVLRQAPYVVANSRLSLSTCRAPRKISYCLIHIVVDIEDGKQVGDPKQIADAGVYPCQLHYRSSLLS